MNFETKLDLYLSIAQSSARPLSGMCPAVQSVCTIMSENGGLMHQAFPGLARCSEHYLAARSAIVHACTPLPAQIWITMGSARGKCTKLASTCHTYFM